MRTGIRNFIATAVLISFSTAVFAHRFHAAITDVSMNPRTGNTEIIHTLMTHDIEALLENIVQHPINFNDADDLALLRQYVEKQFFIETKNQQRMKLNWVGIQLDPDSLLIFQEAEQQIIAPESIMHNALLTDFLADQINTTNLHHDGKLSTLIFDRTVHERALAN